MTYEIPIDRQLDSFFDINLPLRNSAPFLTHFGDDGLWRDFQEAVVGNGRPELSKVILIH